MFLTLLVLISSCLLNTINAEEYGIYHPHPKVEACVVPGTSEQMQKSLDRHDAVFAQINIVTCQPHEVCSPQPMGTYIGKMELGLCKMVRDPIRRKMCLIPGSVARGANPAALTIDLVLCEEDEECVPLPKRRPRENDMMPSIEIGYCKQRVPISTTMRPTTTNEIMCSDTEFPNDMAPECPPGEVCIHGLGCIPGCTSMKPCPMGMECDLRPLMIDYPTGKCRPIPITKSPSPLTTVATDEPLGLPELMNLCVLPGMSETIERNFEHHQALSQINIITCQPHEKCSLSTLEYGVDINIGKFGLGVCEMVRAPMEREVCLMPGSISRSMNPAALTFNLVICKEDELCTPFSMEESESRMMPSSIEIGYCKQITTTTSTTPTTTTVTTTTSLPPMCQPIRPTDTCPPGQICDEQYQCVPGCHWTKPCPMGMECSMGSQYPGNCIPMPITTIPTTSTAGPYDHGLLEKTVCVLPEMSETMLRSLETHPAYAKLNIVTCQPHEECSPMPLNMNIGKFGLGECKMVREPMKRKMCVIPGPMQSRNKAALTIDLVVCEEDEVCTPYESPKGNNMRPSIEIGYCQQLPTPSTTTSTTTTTSSSTFPVLPTIFNDIVKANKCSSDGKCFKGYICIKGECIPGCNNNDDCFVMECVKPFPNVVGECMEVTKPTIVTSPEPISTPAATPPPIVTPGADLELCILPGWNAESRSSDNVIFNVKIVDCKRDEICSPAPETQLFGMKLGRCEWFDWGFSPHWREDGHGN